ncbi:hypothetical protein QZH41_000700 [Actinostola sp. cb2023]|nr:hypothetical protein QZH41_000700 [Actinostola sp. cb2023]
MLEDSAMKYRIQISTSSLRSRSVTFKVLLLDNTEFQVKFDRKKVLGSELFDKVCEQAKISALHQKYFSIRYINSEDGKPTWLNLGEIIKSSLTITATFQLAVQVFPCSISSEVEDHSLQRLVVYQVKDLFLYGKLRTSVEEHAVLDSYFAQAILGDFNSKRHVRRYLESQLGSCFFSHPSFLNSDTEVSAALYERMVSNRHKTHKGMTSDEAFEAYLRLCISVFGYGAFIYKGAMDLNGHEFIIAVSAQGIQIYLPDNLGEPDELVHEFPWQVVMAIMSDGSRFLFSVGTKTSGQRSTSLQMHSFRFPGHYGHLEAQRIECDALHHRDLVLGPISTELKRDTRNLPSKILIATVISFMLAGQAMPSPVRRSISAKTLVHCHVDLSMRLLIKQLLPISQKLSEHVYESVKNLTRVWQFPRTNTQNQGISLVLINDTGILMCFYQELNQSISAFRHLPKTKSRDVVIQKLTNIKYQVKDLSNEIHHVNKALSPTSTKKFACSIPVTKSKARRGKHAIVTALANLLVDLYGQLKMMGVDFFKLHLPSKILIATVISFMLAGQAMPSPVRRSISAKTLVHCHVDLSMRLLIKQLLPISQKLSGHVYESVKNLTRVWQFPRTNTQNQGISLVLINDTGILMCFYQELNQSISAFRHLPKTKSRDAVIQKLTNIKYEIKDLSNEIHHVNKALSPTSTKKFACSIPVTKSKARRGKHAIVTALANLLVDLYGQLKMMGVDFFKLHLPSKILIATVISFMLDGQAMPSPVRRSISAKTLVHCHVDLSMRLLIKQLLPISQKLSGHVYESVKNLTRVWQFPRTNTQNQGISLVLINDTGILMCFYQELNQSISAFRHLPKTKSRDVVIQKLTNIKYQVKDLSNEIHHVNKALSPTSTKKFACSIPVTKSKARRGKHAIVTALANLLVDLYGQLKVMGVDFFKLRKMCPVSVPIVQG